LIRYWSVVSERAGSFTAVTILNRVALDSLEVLFKILQGCDFESQITRMVICQWCSCYTVLLSPFKLYSGYPKSLILGWGGVRIQRRICTQYHLYITFEMRRPFRRDRTIEAHRSLIRCDTMKTFSCSKRHVHWA
jgi:hypothetical protein